VLEPEVMVPAVGQGALAVETRAGDVRVGSLVQALDHRPTRLATCAERAFLARLEGGCQVPIGALGTWQDDSLTLVGIVADVDGTQSVRGVEAGVVVTESEAVGMGRRLADRLIDLGAVAVLERVRAATRADEAARRDQP
jgi:hydroxymethylbilane synthase